MKSFIALEGVDGAGKTTVSERLAHELGATYLRTPGEGYRLARKHVDSSASPQAKLLFYVSSVVDASHQASLIRTSKPVICDRYIWSSLIPHAAYYEQDLHTLEQSWKFITSQIAVPSQTILLRVNEDEQLRRLGDRTEVTASDTYCRKEALRRRARELYDSIAQRDGWTIIETDNKGIEMVVEEILEKAVGVLA